MLLNAGRGARATVPGERVSPGRDGVDGDAVAGEIGGQRAGEADDAAFAGDVMGKAGDHRAERGRRHVDHAAPLARAHAGHEGGGDQEGAVEINRHHLAPVGEAHVGEILLREDAGAVHHDIDVAEFALHLLGHGGDRGFVGDVAFDGDGVAPGGLHHFYRFAAVAEISDRDMHAVFRQSLGKRLPDAAAGAGDDGDFVLVTFGHCLPSDFLASSAGSAARRSRLGGIVPP